MTLSFKTFFKSLICGFLSFTLLAPAFVAYSTQAQTPFHFPKPTGPYATGVKEYHWIDVARKEIFSNDPRHPNRELMINIWYPAQGVLSEKPLTPYVPYRVDYFKKHKILNFSPESFYYPVYSYAQAEVLLASNESRYPVIILSHGCECTRDGYTALCEELASAGYVIVGISHVYYSSIVQFPDGRIVDGKKSLKERWKDKSFVEILRQFDQEIEIWISDIRFVLDQLKQLEGNKESIFYQHLDLQNIGICGHSTGGGASVQVCDRDPRIKAGVALDGFLFGTKIESRTKKPFMFMFAGDSVLTFERPWNTYDWKKFGMNSLIDEKIYKSYYLPATQQFAKSMDHDIYTVIIKNAGHLDFGDTTLFKNDPSFWKTLMISDMAEGAFGVGSIDGLKVTEITNAYIVNFFNKYLKNIPSKLLDGTIKKYPEVEQNFGKIGKTSARCK